MLGPIFMGVSHTWRLPSMYWNQQTADYYASHCIQKSKSKHNGKLHTLLCLKRCARYYIFGGMRIRSWKSCQSYSWKSRKFRYERRHFLENLSKVQTLPQNSEVCIKLRRKIYSYNRKSHKKHVRKSSQSPGVFIRRSRKPMQNFNWSTSK